MKSRTSLVKLGRQLWRRQIWVFALSALGAFLAWPIVSLWAISTLEEQYAAQSFKTVPAFQWVAESYTQMLSSGALGAVVMTAVQGAAVLAAWSGFSALHSREKTDLLRSLPVKWTSIFGLRVVIAALDLAIPALAGMLSVFGIAALRGALTPGVAGAGMKLAAMSVIGGLMTFAVSAMAMLLTGQVLVGALGTAVLLFIGPLLTVLLREYAAAFFDTYWPMTLLTDSWGWRLTSPVMAGFDAARTGGWAILGAAAAAALLLLAARAVDAVRPAEAAGKAMAFPVPTEIIAVVLSATGALLCGAVFRSIRQKDGWFVFGLVFGLLVVYAVYRMITTMDFSRIFSKRGTLFASALLAGLVAAVFRFDLLNYDARLPEEAKITDIAILPGEEFADYYSSIPGISRLNRMTLGCDDALYRFVEKMAKGHMTQTEEKRFLENDEEVSGIVVRVRLQNGREYARKYRMKFDDIAEDMAGLYAREGYLDALYPVRDLPEGCVGTFDIAMPDGTESVLVYENGERFAERLAKAVAEDSRGLSPEEVMRETPVTVLGAALDLTSKGVACSNGGWYREDGTRETKIWNEKMFIWPSFKRTQAVLREAGFEVSNGLPVEKIQNMMLCRTGGPDGFETEEIRDASKIEALAPKLISYRLRTRWIPVKKHEYAQVTVKNTGGFIEENQFYLKDQ